MKERETEKGSFKERFIYKGSCCMLRTNKTLRIPNVNSTLFFIFYKLPDNSNFSEINLNLLCIKHWNLVDGANEHGLLP